MPTTDRLPRAADSLAHLMWDLEQTASPTDPDPATALWEQLREQEGYDVASPLWNAACAHYDHMLTDTQEDPPMDELNDGYPPRICNDCAEEICDGCGGCNCQHKPCTPSAHQEA